MKIVHLAGDVISHTGGGERATLSTVRAINLVTECRLAVVSNKIGSTHFDNIDGIQTDVIPAMLGPFDNPLPRPGPLREVMAGMDIIHVHQLHTLLLDLVQLLKDRNQRLVVSDYGGGGPNVSRLLGRCTRVDGAVAYSDVVRNVVSATCNRIEDIPLPIDTEQFRILPCVEIKEKSVLCVGRLLPHKGFDRVVEALPPDFGLTIVGPPYDREYLGYLQSLSRRKDVTFITDIDDGELVREMNRAAVFVASTVFTDCRGRRHRYPELLGLSPVEAAACGRPVVLSTAVPALQGAIQCGRIVGAQYTWNDNGQLATAISAMATTQVSFENRRYVERECAPREVGMRLVSFYEKLLASPGQ